MKKTLLLGITALALGALAFQPNQADAYRGNPSIYGPNYSQERHTQMEQAFDNKDYNAWKNLMQGRGNVSRVINQDNFSDFAKMHELMLQGKIQEANQIREQLGLGLGMGPNFSR